MKIVHLSTFVNGGAGKAAFRLHLSLLEQGVESHFISLFDYPKEIENFNDVNFHCFIDYKPTIKNKLKNLKIRLNKYKTRNSLKKNLELLDSLKPSINAETTSTPFSNYIIENHPLIKEADVIHLHWVSQMVDYSTFFKFLKKPVIWTLHDMNPFQGLFHYTEDYLRNKDLFYLTEIDKIFVKFKRGEIQKLGEPYLKIVAPSKWLQKEASKSDVFSNYKIELIPNCINSNSFKTLEKAEARKHLNLPESKFIILFIAESINNRRKGFDFILEVLKKFEPDKSPLFLVIGDKVKSIPNSENCILFGRIESDEKLNKFLSAADVFILPSREDNLPNVLLESFASGTPIIGFPIGGLTEHLIEKQTGLIADEINSSSLFNAINKFMEQRQNYSPMTIKKYAIENFSHSTNAKKYICLYKEILSQTKSKTILKEKIHD